MGQDAFRFDHDAAPGDPPPEQWLPRLTRLLQRQSEAVRELNELAVRQSLAVEAEETGEILAILAAREPVVEIIVAINRELEPFARREGGLLAGLEASERAELEQQVASIDAILASVNERDRADRGRMEVARSAIAAELASMQAGRGAVSAYANRPASGARFQDREG